MRKGKEMLLRKALALQAILYIGATEAAGLSKAKSALESLSEQLLIIIPVVATLALIGIGAAYSLNWISRDQLFNWCKGVLLAGSASEIVALFFS